MTATDRLPIRVVLLNWNDRAGTAECLERVRASRGVAPDVLVVDNGSEGPDADRLRERVGEGRVLALPENRGYSGGMNAGLRFWREAGGGPGGGPDGEVPVLLITPDAAVEPDALRRLAEELARSPRAGVVGPLVVYAESGPDGERWLGAGGTIDARRRRAWLRREPAADEPHAVDWIDGCCMLARPEALEAVGGLDERYFLYFEETDLCHRLRREGWEVRLVPDAVVRHPKAPGTLPPHYFHYLARNRYLFWRKNFGVAWPRIALQVLAQTVRAWASVVRALLIPGRGASWRDRLRDARLQTRGAVRGTVDHLRNRHGGIGDR